MAASPLNRALLYFLNALGPFSCALVDGVGDLKDGQAIADAVSAIEGQDIPDVETHSLPITRVRGALCLLAQHHAPLLPDELARVDAAESIVAGELAACEALVALLRRLHASKGGDGGGAANATDGMAGTARGASCSARNPVPAPVSSLPPPPPPLPPRRSQKHVSCPCSNCSALPVRGAAEALTRPVWAEAGGLLSAARAGNGRVQMMHRCSRVAQTVPLQRQPSEDFVPEPIAQRSGAARLRRRSLSPPPCPPEPPAAARRASVGGDRSERRPRSEVFGVARGVFSAPQPDAAVTAAAASLRRRCPVVFAGGPAGPDDNTAAVAAVPQKTSHSRASSSPSSRKEVNSGLLGGKCGGKCSGGDGSGGDLRRRGRTEAAGGTTAALGAGAASRAKPAAAPAAAPAAVVFPAAATAARRRDILLWMRDALGVPVDGAMLVAPTTSPAAAATATLVDSRLSGGSTLSELAAALERALGAGRDGAAGRMEAQGHPGRFVLHGTVMEPKSRAQAMRNVELALAALRRLPRAAGLFAADAATVVAGDDAAIWSVLCDAWRAFHRAVPAHRRGGASTAAAHLAAVEAAAAVAAVAKRPPAALVRRLSPDFLPRERAAAAAAASGPTVRFAPHPFAGNGRSGGGGSGDGGDGGGSSNRGSGSNENERMAAVSTGGGLEGVKRRAAALRGRRRQPTAVAGRGDGTMLTTPALSMNPAAAAATAAAPARERFSEVDATASPMREAVGSQQQAATVGSCATDGGTTQQPAAAPKRISKAANSAATAAGASAAAAAYRGDRSLASIRWTPPRSLAEETASDSAAAVAASVSAVLPPITAQQEAAGRQWLCSRGLIPVGGLLPVGASCLLRDPLRNGTLLCQLVGAVRPAVFAAARLARLVHWRPSSAAAALENIRRALWLLRLHCAPPLPRCLLAAAEPTLAGDRDAIWGLLWHASQHFPADDNGGDYDGYGESSGCAVGSTVAAAGGRSIGGGVSGDIGSNCVGGGSGGNCQGRSKVIESAILAWIGGMDVLDAFAGAGVVPPSLGGLERWFRDGTLLCALTEKAAGRPVAGWLRRPRTVTSAAANVAKAVAALRGWRPMPRRHLWPGIEAALCQGDWRELVGLLEDMRVASGGGPPAVAATEATVTAATAGAVAAAAKMAPATTATASASASAAARLTGGSGVKNDASSSGADDAQPGRAATTAAELGIAAASIPAAAGVLPGGGAGGGAGVASGASPSCFERGYLRGWQQGSSRPQNSAAAALASGGGKSFRCEADDSATAVATAAAFDDDEAGPDLQDHGLGAREVWVPPLSAEDDGLDCRPDGSIGGFSRFNGGSGTGGFNNGGGGGAVEPDLFAPLFYHQEGLGASCRDASLGNPFLRNSERDLMPRSTEPAAFQYATAPAAQPYDIAADVDAVTELQWHDFSAKRVAAPPHQQNDYTGISGRGDSGSKGSAVAWTAIAEPSYRSVNATDTVLRLSRLARQVAWPTVVEDALPDAAVALGLGHRLDPESSETEPAGVDDGSGVVSSNDDSASSDEWWSNRSSSDAEDGAAAATAAGTEIAIAAEEESTPADKLLAVASALSAVAASASADGFRLRPDRLARLRSEMAGAVEEVYATPRGAPAEDRTFPGSDGGITGAGGGGISGTSSGGNGGDDRCFSGVIAKLGEEELGWPPQPTAQQVHTVATWLASRRIVVRDTTALLKGPAPEFADGVILARLVERLGGAPAGAGAPPGGGSHGDGGGGKGTAATRTQRVRRCLEWLVAQRRAPGVVVTWEAALLAADHRVAVALLLAVRRSALGGR